MSPPLAIPAPATARQLAFAVLQDSRDSGRFLQDVLADLRDSGDRLSGVDRRFAVEIANEVVRRQITLDAILRQYVRRPQPQVEPALWLLLQIGVCQLVLMSGVPPHAAVAETVDLARWIERDRWCGFLNGVLRSLSRDIAAELRCVPDSQSVPVRSEAASGDQTTNFRTIIGLKLPDPATDRAAYVAAACGLPDWLVGRWAHRLDDEQLLLVGNWFAFQQPLIVRVNPLRTTVAALIERLRESTRRSESVQPGRLTDSIVVSARGRVTELPGFAEGHFTVQDETAMSASLLLNPRPGECVLDLCAAPGTKTTHLAELMNNDGRILATDVSPRRLAMIKQNTDRLGISIVESRLVRKDLSDLSTELFDAVLVDAPCSNTGVLGKRLEARHRLNPGEIDEHAQTQVGLLNAAIERTRPGGRVVYSTCSIEPEENSGVVARVLESRTDLRLESSREFFPGEPADGGYQALLRRRDS